MSEKNLTINNTNGPLSPLRMSHIVFNKINFERFDFCQPGDEIQFQASKEIEKIDEGHYRISLNVIAEKKQEYTAEVNISGYCEVPEDHPSKECLIQKNAIAILFPYLRSELTLLTSQPETHPIVLPIVNINAMFGDK